MIEIVDYNPSHIDEIMTRPRDRELKYSALEEWGNWKQVWRASDMAFTLFIDGRPIGSAGIVSIGNATGEAWAVLSSEASKHRLSVFRAVRNGLNEIVNKFGFKHIQSFVDVDFQEAKHFMYHLGFIEKEIGNFGPRGEPMVKFWRECR